MVKVVQVKLWGKLVGAALWNDKLGYASFEYEPDFISSNLEVAPLTMQLPSGQSTAVFSFPALNYETFKGLPGLLADSLPDRFGSELIDNWLAMNGRIAAEVNPVERLCFTGKRGMGALEFEPVNDALSEGSSAVDIAEVMELANELLAQKKKLSTSISVNRKKAITDIIKIGTSAGGARAKAVIAINKKTGEIRSGQIDNGAEYEYRIIKFDGVNNKQLGDPMGYGKIEFAYYQMAIACGIEMMPSELLQTGENKHFMTTRFDRVDGQKLHMQTLCGIAHFDYNNPLMYSYEQVFQVMRQLYLPYSDALQLYKRMIFNIVARNQDDHTKNFSFLMNPNGEWKLSPAYDITFAYNPENRWLKNHQLSVHGKRSDINKLDVLAVAEEMNIKKPSQIIEEVVESISNWKKIAEKVDIPKEQANAIAKTHLIKQFK